MQVILRVPNSPEPYKNLAFIHEEQHDLEKAMDFYSIAARMTPKVWP